MIDGNLYSQQLMTLKIELKEDDSNGELYMRYRVSDQTMLVQISHVWSYHMFEDLTSSREK